jgi:ABC-type nitrate/sulfonate/bicarbonate transport system permease component
MQAQNQFLMPLAYATVFVLAAFALAIFGLLTLAERVSVPWAYQARRELPA